MATGRESDKFMLRLPDGMRERIKAAADENSRSMNAEIVATLEEKYPAPFDSSEDFAMACAAATAFHPQRSEDFRAAHDLVLSYMSEKFGAEIADRVAQHKYSLEPLENIGIERLVEWQDRVLFPWVAARRASIDAKD